MSGRSHCGTSLLSLASILALLAIAGAAYGQEGPTVIGGVQELPRFGWDKITGSFNLLTQYSRDESNPSVAQGSQSDELRFEESISLQTRAYVIHPNFLTVDMLGQFGLTQEDFHSDELDEQTNGTLYLWNINAAFFRENATSFSLYTDRTEDVVDRAFSESFRSTYTTYGALFTTQSTNWLTTFRIYRTEQEQSALGGGDDFTLNENVFEWHGEGKPSPNQYLTWDYRLGQTDQTSTTGADDSTNSQSLGLGHTLGFGPAGAHTLVSTMNYSESTGNFGIDHLRWDELMRLHHSTTFETEYEYTFDRQTSDTIDQTSQRATAEFRHKLYKSLFTHGQAGLLNLDTGDGGGTQDMFADIDWQYLKTVPYGRLDGTMNIGYNYRDTKSNSQAINVVNQPFFFSGFQPIIIPGQTLSTNSIVIEDSTGRIFTEGIDYIVTPRPDGARIDRVVGGAIPADSTVLVDYTLDPIPDTQIGTSVFAFSLRYDILEGPLRGLSPYLRYAMIDQTVDGGAGQIEPDSVRDYVAGVEYRIWDLTLISEYEIYDSTLVPFDALRFIARYNHRVSYDTVVSGNANYTYTDYTDLDQQNTTINMTGTVTHRFSRQWYGSATAGWVDIDDSAGGHTQGFQQSMELRWRYRQVEVYGRARNSNLTSDDQDSNFQFFELGLTREF